MSKNTKKIFLMGIFLLGALLQTGCFVYNAYLGAPLSTIPEADHSYDKKWDKYGAYYVLDDAVYSIRRGYSFEFVVKKRIKIINTDGAKYGTVPIDLYSRRINKFTVQLINKDGVNVKLPVAKMRADYYKTEKVVFPNVTEGCELYLEIAFLGVSPTFFYDYSFEREIPIVKGRFNFNNEIHNAIRFHTQLNDPRKQIGVFDHSSGSTNSNISWEVNDYEPYSYHRYSLYPSEVESYVSIAVQTIKSYDGWGGANYKNYDTWGALAEAYDDRVKDIKKDLSYQNIKAIINRHTDSKDKPLEKCKKILKWVQDSIKVSRRVDDRGAYSAYFDKKGSFWDVAVLTKMVFTECGIKTDICLGNSKQYLPLQKEFVTRSVLRTPFLVLKDDNKRVAAWPYFVGYTLGEYPSSYEGTLCLNLKSQEVESMPSLRWRNDESVYKTVVDLTDEGLEHSIEMTFKFSEASMMRQIFHHLDEEAQKKVCQKMLESRGETNKVSSVKIIDQEKIGEPMTIKITFDNALEPIPYKNSNIYEMKDFCREFLSSVADQKSKVIKSRSKDITKDILVIKTSSRSGSVNINNVNIRNKFFHYSQRVSKSGSTYTITRTLETKVCEVNNLGYDDIVRDINKINTYSDLKLTVTN